MAAIDKIYLSGYDNYLQFKDWCKEQPLLEDKYGKKVSLMTYLYDYDEQSWGDKDNTRPVFNAPYYVDAYLIRNCPFDGVQKELMINYGHKSQERIDEAYKIVMDRGGEKDETEKSFYWWLTKDDFKVVDGVVTYPKNENSDYSRIKRGELYTTPFTSTEYAVGTKVRCTQHPVKFYNRPFATKYWMVSVNPPEEFPYMWYHEKTKTWDFADEFVVSDWSSSSTFVPTIKALKRLLLKWKLPVGTTVRVTGRYVADTYEFVIKK